MCSRGLRKYSIVAFYTIASMAMLIFKVEHSLEWTQATSLLIIAYLGANTGEHYVKSIRTKSTNKR